MPTAALRDYCLRITKGTTPTTLGRPFVTEGINFIKSEAITADGRIDPVGFAFIDEETHQALARSVLRESDVLFSMAGVYLGKTAVVSRSILPANTNQAVGIIRVDMTRADPRFIHYALSSPAVRSLVRRSVAQSAQPNFNLRDIGELPIPRLPLGEQRAIGHILGTLDDKIELNRRMNETLEAMARAIFKSWFVDFDPVRAKAVGRQPFAMDAKTAALFPDSFEDSPLGKIPKGWQARTLGEMLTQIEVGTRPKGGVGALDAGIPSVGAESIAGLGKFDFSKTKYVPVEFYNQMKRGRVQDRDVLLYKDGGRPGEYEPHVAMFGEGFPFPEFCINEHVYRLRTDPPIPQSFLYFWLTSVWATEEMRVKGTGVAVPGLNSSAVRSLAIIGPGEAILRAFQGLVSPLLDRVFNNCNNSRLLEQIRNALLPRLISGEIRLKAAEKVMERMT